MESYPFILQKYMTFFIFNEVHVPKIILYGEISMFNASYNFK